MEILCHRGYWKEENERNTIKSIRAALESGRGIESDIRDLDKMLVISHDLPDKQSPMAEEVFKLMAEYENKYCFAINIKSDGLKDILMEQLQKYHIVNYFVFDMSVPQIIEYQEKGIRYYTRQSEYEKQPVLYREAAGVWIDAFEDDSWITEELIYEHQKNGKKICVVSPDLHQRDNIIFWNRLLTFKINWQEIMLCTDYPDDAISFFEKNKE